MPRKPKAKTQKHSVKSVSRGEARKRQLAGLVPFKTGYDPRRNYHGRPKSIDELRELVRDVGQDEIELPDGHTVPRLHAKVLEMFDSRDPRDSALILQYGFGKVPDELKVKSWQDEIIQALKENLISSLEVIKVLGLEDARPILIAASATIPIDLSAAQESEIIDDKTSAVR